MGWVSGCTLMTGVIAAVKANVPEFPRRKAIYAPIIAALDADYDDDDGDAKFDCLGIDPAFDEALLVAHPDILDQDDEDLDDMDDEDEDDYDDADDAEDDEEDEEEAA